MSASLTGKKIFGAGRFFGINAVSNPTPMRAYVPQDQSIDFKLNTKTLLGENRLPVAVAAGDMSVTGKVTMGANSARLFADLMFAIGSSSGTIIEQDFEAGTIPGSVAYTVTVANSAAWTTDLGVVLAADGPAPLRASIRSRLASIPSPQQTRTRM
jgi:D-aminopeptidase